MRTPRRIPFELTESNGIVVDATLNGVDPVRLLFHTAVEGLFVTEDAAARLDSITFDDAARGTSWGGSSEVRYSHRNSLEIGDLEWSDVGITEDSLSGKGSDGKFGWDFLREFVVEIDYEDRTLVLHDELPLSADALDALPIEFGPYGMTIEAGVQLDSDEVAERFLVHSGFAGSVLFRDAFVQEQALEERLEPLGQRELRDALGNVLVTRRARLPGLELGSVPIEDVPCEFFLGESRRNDRSLIGAFVLRRFHLVFDLPGGALYVRPNGSHG